MAEHDCPGRCGSRVPQHQLACKPCWSRLPRPLRDNVSSAYRIRMRKPSAHREALVAALAWYRTNPEG